MVTKLVYVLTCAPEKHYIEQALISVFSARHWNPDAYIVLIVDDNTDQLFVGKRALILDYVSEKIVVPFEDTTLPPMYRSRWIKTSVRHLVKGRYLFIDCDTIVAGPLDAVDGMNMEIGAVPDALIPVKEYSRSMFAPINKRAKLVGYDLSKEVYHFNSGVMLVEDNEQANRLYDLWHSNWLSFTEKKLFVDQPTLALSDVEMEHVIQPMDVRYNCIVYTQNVFTREAKILHISSYRNPSFIFSDKVLEYIKENGLDNEWLLSSILNPCSTFLPFDYDVLHSNAEQRRMWRKEIARTSKGYGKTIDSSFEDFPMPSRLRGVVLFLFRNGLNGLAAGLWMLWKRWYVAAHKKRIKDNICKK